MEANDRDVYQAVLQGNVELGIATEIKAATDICFIPIYKDRLHVVVPEGHALVSHRSYIDWTALETYPYVMLRAGTAAAEISFKNIYLRPALQVDHVASALAMVRNGVGISVLLSRILPELNMKGLIALPLSGKSSSRTVGIFYRRSHPLSITACNFIDILKESS